MDALNALNKSKETFTKLEKAMDIKIKEELTLKSIALSLISIADSLYCFQKKFAKVVNGRDEIKIRQSKDAR